MKLGSVTKPDKRKKTTSKKFCDDVMSEYSHTIAIFPIYSQFGAIWKPDSRCIVCKTYFFINTNFFLQKLKTELKNLWHRSSTIALTILVLFWPKSADFCKRNANINKIKRVLLLKGIFYESTHVCDEFWTGVSFTPTP